MRKAELVKRATDRLREIRARKPVSIPAHTFHISDDIGNTSDFKVKPSKGLSAYTMEDVSVILDALIHVTEDAISHGENVSIHGFASIKVKYHHAKPMKMPDTGEWIEVPGRYVPKVDLGNELRRAAKMYGLSLKDKVNNADFLYSDEMNRYSEDAGGDESDAS